MTTQQNNKTNKLIKRQHATTYIYKTHTHKNQQNTQHEHNEHTQNKTQLTHNTQLHI